MLSGLPVLLIALEQEVVLLLVPVRDGLLDLRLRHRLRLAGPRVPALFAVHAVPTFDARALRAVLRFLVLVHLLDLVFDFLNAQLVLRGLRVHLALIHVVQKQLLLVEDGNMLRLARGFLDGVPKLEVARLLHKGAQGVILARLRILDLVLVLEEFK